ncbi:ATP-binding protein [Streptomyces monashensis]|nr:ATP-binding protein [Streptomyces monashensis]
MDPTDPGHPGGPGPEGHGQAPGRRAPREPVTSDFGTSTPPPVRTAQLVTGDLLLTVNPVDGSEIEPCPPAQRPAAPRKRTAAERAETERAARPPAPAGPAQPPLALLERQDERERLVRLLARGRSVRLTGPGGSGRTALLDLVAEDCQDLAPDGVIRLSGFHRGSADVLHDLFHAVYDAPGHRPAPDDLRALVAEIGAVVVLDDIEFGGAGLEELLDTARECAFVIGATPDVPAPSAASAVEEVFLGGLDRAAGVQVLERTVGRVLTEEEANWAGDLWFESEGLPLRFVQAGALLRQRDELRAGPQAADQYDEYGVFEDARPDARPPVDLAAEPADAVPLPSLGEAAAPAPLLASRLGDSARATLRFAVALGGEVPHQAHLPALVGDTHADAALGELAGCGLVSPVGSRYRLAAGVQTQLEAAGYADDAPDRVLAAAEHYTWWTGHPSVTPERVSAEADAVLAALAAVVPQTSAPVDGEESRAVRLARTAAPSFAAGLRWGAWERALRSGAEAARLAGDVHEQAYFHHELGVLALCTGQLDRARAELEASIGLRGALADKRGTVAGRRALALVADRSGELPGITAMAGEELPEIRHEESAPPPYAPLGEALVTQRLPAAPARGGIGGIRRLARRNLVAAGSGALLAVVLGTVVTLGMTSHENADKHPAGKVDVNPSISEGTDGGSLGADPGQSRGGGTTGGATGRPTTVGAHGTSGTTGGPGPSTDPARPSESISPSGSGRTSPPPSKSPKPSGSSGSSGSTGGTGTGGSTGGSSTGGTTGSTGTSGSTGTASGGTGSSGGSTGTSTGGTGSSGGSTGTTGSTTGSTGGSSTGGSTGTSTGGSTSGTTGTTTSSASAPQSAPQPSGTVA